MVEYTRVFRGATELNVSEAKLTRSNDFLVDKASIDCEADYSVTVGSVIDFTKSDGSTAVFSAKVQEIRTPDVWKIEAFTNGFELLNIRVETVYTDKSPEYIIADVVARTSNLTYVSTSASGIVIEKYVAKAYGIDIIKDMVYVLQWQFTIDKDDQVHCDPKTFINNGVVLTNGVNFQVTEWNDNKLQMFNQVKVVGGFESVLTFSEAKVGVDTVFLLDHKPLSSVRAVVSGVEVSANDYVVDAEEKTVTFSSTKTNPSFDYAYQIPVVVQNQDDDSINTYDVVFKEVPAPWLNRIVDARVYSQKLLDAYSTPFQSLKGYEAGLNFDRTVGEVVVVNDPVRSDRSITSVITKIVWDLRAMQTKIEVGDRDFMLYDWQSNVEERIKKIERRSINEDELVIARLHKAKLKVKLTISNVFEKASPRDSFVTSHPTLSWTRDSFADEADCSGNGHYGLWHGTGIDGSQFGEGYRLSCGNFNGSDNYVSVADSIAGVQSLMLFIYPDVLNKDIMKLSSSAKISVNSSGAITTSGLTGVSYHVGTVLSGTVVVSTWNLVTVDFDAVTADAIEIGRSSSYFDGKIDEVRLFDDVSTDFKRTAMIAKDFYLVDNSYVFTDLVAHWSMDNPYTGDRTTARVGIDESIVWA